MAKTGRPPVDLKPPPLAKQLELYGAIMTRAQIAGLLGVSESTLERKLKKTPALLTALKKGQALGIATVAQNLMTQASKGNVTAQIFFLKTRAGWTERAPAEAESFNPDDYTDAELELIIAGEPVDRIKARRARAARGSS